MIPWEIVLIVFLIYVASVGFMITIFKTSEPPVITTITEDEDKEDL